MQIRPLFAIAGAILIAGCVTAETVRFQPRANQQALVRDGVDALISRQRNSIVLIRPASRAIQANGRPVFVVGIYNMSKAPLEFRMANVAAHQIVNQQAFPLQVLTYEKLVAEEKTRQVVSALLVGAAAGANAWAASQSGYGTADTTVHTPHGTYTAHSHFYSPSAAAIAQANAAAQNEAMITATIERGQANLATLERDVIKDNTLLPGEWYGGQLHIAPPVAEAGGRKTYLIAITIGGERHEIEIVQGSAV